MKNKRKQIKTGSFLEAERSIGDSIQRQFIRPVVGQQFESDNGTFIVTGHYYNSGEIKSIVVRNVNRDNEVEIPIKEFKENECKFKYL